MAGKSQCCVRGLHYGMRMWHLSCTTWGMVVGRPSRVWPSPNDFPIMRATTRNTPWEQERTCLSGGVVHCYSSRQELYYWLGGEWRALCVGQTFFFVAGGPSTLVGRELPTWIEKFGWLCWYEFWAFWGVFIHVGAVVTAWVPPSFFRVPSTEALLLLLGATLEAYPNLPFLSPDSILSPVKMRSAKLASIYPISFS